MTGQVAVQVEDGTFGGYLAEPDVSNGSAIIVLQEIFGVTSFIREVCDWLATQGYVAFAPDLFWRDRPGVDLAETQRDEAMALMNGLDTAKTLRDCAFAAAHLRARRTSNGKVGAVGYCFGGKLAFLLTRDALVDCAVSYYGTGIHGLVGDPIGPQVPMLLHIATEDALCSAQDQATIADRFVSDPLVTITFHEGAGHAFARSGSPAFIAEACERANSETLQFFQRHLVSQ